MKLTDQQRAELKALAEGAKGWSNCNQAWLDTSEDTACATFGHITEDGETYPLAVIDCKQYYSGDSLLVAKYYAAANPASVLALLADLEGASLQEDEMRANACYLSEERKNLLAENADLRRQLEQYKRALQNISAIENKIDCGDWDEIEEARAIAIDALSAKGEEQ